MSQDGALGWHAKPREPGWGSTQMHIPTQAFRVGMLKGSTAEAWLTQWHLKEQQEFTPEKCCWEKVTGKSSSVPLCSSLAIRMQCLAGNRNSATRKSIWTVQWFLISWLHLTLNNYFHFKGQIPIPFKTPPDFSGIWPSDNMEIKETLRVTKKLQKY